MEYVSCFTGISGLDGPYPPIGYSEIDETCLAILGRKYPKSLSIGSISDAKVLNCEVLTAGWPCQDISIAGKRQGLKGKNSKLFYKMVDYAKKSGAHTIIAENVRNILLLDDGALFKVVLSEFVNAGYRFCSWRTLNTREFGLPHHRNRVFFIASKKEEVCLNLFRKHNENFIKTEKSKTCAFYWTAGTHSINYSRGYIPTLKLGGSFETPCSIAVFKNQKLRVLSGLEAIKLQGFDPVEFENIKNGKLVNLAGNAVSLPVGKFVFNSLFEKVSPDLKWELLTEDLFGDNFIFSSDKNPPSGFYDGKLHIPIISKPPQLASNLDEYLESDFSIELSKRASTGLLRRLNLSNSQCPIELRSKLEELSNE